MSTLLPCVTLNSFTTPLRSTCRSRSNEIWQMLAAVVLTISCSLGSDRAQAQVQTYPNRPITLVVGFPPGGGSDAVARKLGIALSAKWGQQVVVDNKPGGNTIIATQYVRSRPADGYTLLYTSASFAINPSLQKVGYDIYKDFAPIAMVDYAPLLLITSNNSPAKSYKELVSMVKQGGADKFSYASFGVGSAGHLASELLLARSGMAMIHVPYKGSAPGIVDVMGGQVTVMMPSVASALSLVKQGKLRPLAVSSARRVPSLPDVPTLAESGAPGYDLTTWSTVLAPAGTSPEIVSRLNAAIREILATPEMRNEMLANGGDPELTKTPAEVAKYIRSEADKFAKIVRSRNIKAE